MASYTSALKKNLVTAGCSRVRHGKGDHEIWYSPISGKHFPVTAISNLDTPRTKYLNKPV
jgi:hypothetical protein